MALPSTYKAAVCTGPYKGWQITQKSLRELSPSEVLIKVYASGICQSDHFVKENIWPGVVFPRVAGHEVVGRVVSLGETTSESSLCVGTLVGVGWNGGYCHFCARCRSGDFPGCVNQQVTGCTVDGGHAEYIYAHVTAVVLIPEELVQSWSYAELAPLMCAGLTAYGAFGISNFKPGDICLVHGIGGLGHLAIQYASRLGLKVYAVSSGPSKRELAIRLGAFSYIDSSATSVVEVMQDLGGANLIISTSPVVSSISSILPAAARNGDVTIISSPTSGRLEVDTLSIVKDRVTIRGWTCGAAPDTEECIRFSILKDVRPLIQTWTLEDYAKAYDDTMRGGPRFQNVILF